MQFLRLFVLPFAFCNFFNHFYKFSAAVTISNLPLPFLAFLLPLIKKNSQYNMLGPGKTTLAFLFALNFSDFFLFFFGVFAGYFRHCFCSQQISHVPRSFFVLVFPSLQTLGLIYRMCVRFENKKFQTKISKLGAAESSQWDVAYKTG